MAFTVNYQTSIVSTCKSYNVTPVSYKYNKPALYEIFTWAATVIKFVLPQKSYSADIHLNHS